MKSDPTTYPDEIAVSDVMSALAALGVGGSLHFFTSILIQPGSVTFVRADVDERGCYRSLDTIEHVVRMRDEEMS